MSTEKIKNIKESPEIKLNQGVDELAAVTDVGFNKVLEMDNWRVSEDGERCEKRDGVTEIAGQSTFGNKDVFGYHTYYDTTPAFCQLVITEEKVWRKVGAAAWASIHTWASTLAHPVKVLDIQGKQIIITEIENIMILPDGTKVQVGITAPATVPTIAAEYTELDLDADCSSLTTWTDADAGSGASTQVTFDSKSCFKFLTTASSGDIAMRRKAMAEIGPDYTFETSIYFDEMGIADDTDHFEINIYNGRIKLRVRIDSQAMYIYDGLNWQVVLENRFRERTDEREAVTTLADETSEEMFTETDQEEYWVTKACPIIIKDTWHTLKLAVKSSDPDNEIVDVYVDDKLMGEYSCANKDTTNPGRIELAAYGDSTATIVYTDWIKFKSADIKSGNLKGIYRYAVTYARSGNYPNESNPIKAVVGTATLTGSGLDDLTTGGTYTGNEDITIRVEIDAAAATDTMKWSEDGGQTWNSTGIPLTSTVYLPFGIELTWGATTGHTAGDYWDFTCDSLTVNPTNQKVALSSIPTSSDAQVDQRKIYRTQPGGTSYYLVAIINDNSTTTFVDNIPNALLGAPMSEDNDIAPLGKYSEWWDGRLWIADQDENLVYHSKTWVPDSFDTNKRYVSVRRGISDDEIMNMVDFSSHLYVLKRSGITFVRRKLTGFYGVYDGPGANGCIAPWTLLEAYGLLMYLSFRGWEVYNGQDSFSILFSKSVMNTVKSLDKTKAEYAMAARLNSRDEIWLSIPDRTGGASATTVVLNKTRSAFYTFSFSKTPSCLCEVRDSSKEIQLVMGTRDGYVGTTESGTQDFSTNITATVRTGWWKFPKYQNFPMTEVEYECPTDKNLTFNQYVNFDKDTKRTKVLAGATPASTDQSIRLPIKNRIKTAIRGKYLAFKFSNAENIGSTVKLNWFKQFYAPMSRKGEIKGD